jgi:hypothetical protein
MGRSNKEIQKDVAVEMDDACKESLQNELDMIQRKLEEEELSKKQKCADEISEILEKYGFALGANTPPVMIDAEGVLRIGRSTITLVRPNSE